MSHSSDELSVLQAVAAAGGPVGMFDVITWMHPVQRMTTTAGRRAWQSRQSELIDTFLALYRRGMLGEVVPVNGSTGDMYALTPDGMSAINGE